MPLKNKSTMQSVCMKKKSNAKNSGCADYYTYISKTSSKIDD